MEDIKKLMDKYNGNSDLEEIKRICAQKFDAIFTQYGMWNLVKNKDPIAMNILNVARVMDY